MAMASSPWPVILLLLLLSILLTVSAGQPKERVTRMKFYLHEQFGGPNATANIMYGNTANFTFGNIGMIDDALRAGPEPTSKLLGRAQGFTPDAALDGQAIFVGVNFLFTAGAHKGSTLTAVGWLDLGATTREWSVVGGTGRFRMARGYVAGKTLKVTASGFFLVEFHDVYILHH